MSSLRDGLKAVPYSQRCRRPRNSHCLRSSTTTMLSVFKSRCHFDPSAAPQCKHHKVCYNSLCRQLPVNRDVDESPRSCEEVREAFQVATTGPVISRTHRRLTRQTTAVRRTMMDSSSSQGFFWRSHPEPSDRATTSMGQGYRCEGYTNHHGQHRLV